MRESNVAIMASEVQPSGENNSADWIELSGFTSSFSKNMVHMANL